MRAPCFSTINQNKICIMASRFLVFGGTGQIGRLFIERALEQGHNVTLLARNPSKLPESIRDHKHVAIIEGGLDDAQALEKALHCGAQIFVSLAGPLFSAKGTPITDCYTSFLPLLGRSGFKRALVLSTPSCPDPHDAFSLMWKSGWLFMNLFARHMYSEMHGVGQVAQALPLDSTLKWTVFRVGGLKDGAAAPVEATYLGSGTDRMSITRASVAEWVLQEAGEKSEWVGKSPYICNK